MIEVTTYVFGYPVVVSRSILMFDEIIEFLMIATL